MLFYIMRIDFLPKIQYTLMVVLLSVLVASSSHAATCKWISNSSTDWNTAGNWSSGTVPNNSDAVIFDNSSTVNCVLPSTGTAPSALSITMATGTTITVSMGSLTLTVGSGGFTVQSGSFVGGTASITINGPFSQTGGTFTATSGSMNVKNNFSISGTSVFNHGNGTLNLNGSVDQLIAVNNTSPSMLNNLTLSGSAATITIGSAIILRNNLTIGSGKVLNTSLNNYSIDVAGNWTNNGTFTPNNSTVTLNVFAASTKTLNNGTSSFYNLTISPTATATHTITGIVTVNGILTLGGTGTITLNTGEIQAKGNITLTNTATSGGGSATITLNGPAAQTITSTLPIGQCRLPGIKLSNSINHILPANLTVGGNWTYVTGNVNFPSGATVMFTGSTGIVTSEAVPFQNVNINGTSVSLGSAMKVAGNLTISSGRTLNTSASNFQIEVAGNWINSGSFIPNSGTVVFNGTAQSINNGTSSNFNNVQLSAPSGTTTLAANVRVMGDLTISPGEILDVSASNFQLSVGGNWVNEGTFTPRAGTVILNGSTQSVNNGSSNFNALRLSSPAGTTSLAANTRLNGILTIDAEETLDATWSNYQLNVAGNWSNNGTFLPGGGLVVLNGTAQSIRNADGSFHDLKLSGTTTTLVTDIIINGTLTIDATNNFNASTFQITVGGNWIGNGIFNSGTSLVLFNGGTQTISGATTQSFYKLQLSNTSLTLNIPVTVTNNLNLNQGILYTRNGAAVNVLLMTAGSTVMGGSLSSFVSGPMQKRGNTAFTFPVGKKTTSAMYQPIGITPVSGLASDNYQVEYFNASPSIAPYSSSIKDVSNCEYWNTQRIAGSASVQYTIGWKKGFFPGTTCMKINVQPITIAVKGASWSDAGKASTTGDSYDGTVTSLSTSSFGDVTLGYRSLLILDTRLVNAAYYWIGNVETFQPSPYFSGSEGSTGSTTQVSDANNIPGVMVFHPTYPSVVGINLGVSDTYKGLDLQLTVDESSNVTAVKANLEGTYNDLVTDFYSISGNTVTFRKEKLAAPSLNISTNLPDGITFKMSSLSSFQITVPSPGFTSYVLRIYDKSNSNVFTSSSLTTSPIEWNGMNGGNPFPEGLYKFQLDIVSASTTYTYNGQLILKY